MIYQVIDREISSVLNTQYELAFFASGYEQRCTHVPKLLNSNMILNTVVLGFSELNYDEQRVANNDYFAQSWGKANDKTVSSNDDGVVYEMLRTLTASFSGTIRILVDYSSMSRLWYSAILNWARFTPDFELVSVDLVYSVGSHHTPTAPMVIDDIVCIPGCEGGSVPIFRSVAVFGLGFEGSAALCVLDRLEPDEVYSYFASPAAFEDYPQRAKKANHELVKHSNSPLPLPLSSVQQAYSLLSELIAPHRSEAEIVLIPMGPKPHVLAAILLAMRFEEVACLRVSGRRELPEEVCAIGEVVSTRIDFKPTIVGFQEPSHEIVPLH